MKIEQIISAPGQHITFYGLNGIHYLGNISLFLNNRIIGSNGELIDYDINVDMFYGYFDFNGKHSIL